MAGDSLFEHRCWGCVLGAFAGDAAGALLEFSHEQITRQRAEEALSMPGGGVFRVGPGQVTDDSELAMGLALGLADHNPANGFPDNDVAKHYVAWLQSPPFDVGMTCRTAFGVKPEPTGTLGQRMAASSSENCSGSQANGALMRLTPLAVWAAGQPKTVVAEMAARDAQLSHPAPVCQDASIIYCLVIRHLINHPGDAAGAVQVAEEWAREYCDASVASWVCQDSLDLSSLDATHNIGWCKWAIILSIGLLRQKASYTEGIIQTLMAGGDTDTNAAIVGGVLGALHGQQAIPEAMRTAVLSYGLPGTRHPPGACRGHTRPEWLTPGKVLPAVMPKLVAWAQNQMPQSGGLPAPELPQLQDEDDD